MKFGQKVVLDVLIRRVQTGDDGLDAGARYAGGKVRECGVEQKWLCGAYTPFRS